MIDHVVLHATDVAASAAFYATLLAPLGASATAATAWDGLRVVPADASHPATRGLHVGFAATSRSRVDAAWRAAVDAGHPDDGAPGPRDYTPDYYGAFVLDPDANSAEAVHYTGMRERGLIDHVWLRVPDVLATVAFYREIADAAGLQVVRADAGHALVRTGGGGSISFVPAAGTAGTRGARIAYGVEHAGTGLEATAPDGHVVAVVTAP